MKTKGTIVRIPRYASARPSGRMSRHAGSVRISRFEMTAPAMVRRLGRLPFWPGEL